MPIIGVPSVVVAIYSTNAGQSIPHNISTIVNYDDKIKDTHDAVTTGAAWKFTAPVSGFYLVNARILYVATIAWDAGEFGELSGHVNGGGTFRLCFEGSYGSDVLRYMNLHGGGLTYLNVGDYVDISCKQQTGGALALIASAPYNTVAIVKYAGA